MMKDTSDYEMRLAAALAELQQRGVRRRIAQPPYFQLARKLNINIKPPYYASYGSNAVFSCVAFTLIWGAALSVIVGPDTDLSMTDLMMNAFNGGLIVGLITALFCYCACRFHQLTPWHELLKKDREST